MKLINFLCHSPYAGLAIAVVDGIIGSFIEWLFKMTCEDCIHLQPNTEHCNRFDTDVDTKAYRLCTEAKEKDKADTDDCWESVSK